MSLRSEVRRHRDTERQSGAYARVAEVRESSIEEMLVLMDVIAMSTSLSFLSAWRARLDTFSSTSCLYSAVWVVICCRRVEARMTFC